MKLLKKIKTFLQNMKTRFTLTKVRNKYGADCRNNVQKERQIVCVINGHIWDHDFDPASVGGKKIAERTYCKVCGVKYHKPKYRKTNI